MGRVRRSIHFTSSAEGMTIGVEGDSWIECLVALTEEFGEGVLPMFEATKAEMSGVAKAIEDAWSEETRDARDRLNGALVQEATAEVDAPSRTVPTQDPPVDAPGPDPFAARPESEQLELDAPDDDGRTPVDGTGSDEAPAVEECLVCGRDVDAKFASYARLMSGETRCPDCMTV